MSFVSEPNKSILRSDIGEHVLHLAVTKQQDQPRDLTQVVVLTCEQSPEVVSGKCRGYFSCSIMYFLNLVFCSYGS